MHFKITSEGSNHPGLVELFEAPCQRAVDGQRLTHAGDLSPRTDWDAS